MEKFYHNDPRLSDYNFEDSFVLGISLTDNSLCIRVELALMPTHRGYTTPDDNQARCFRRGEIYFADVRNIEVLTLELDPSVDANGECDLGAIYDVHEVRPSVYKFWAEFGSMVIEAETLAVRLR
jgi:hypothetical protein